jgi:ankyrin repeat protein
MTDSNPLLSFLLDSDFRDKYPHQLVARYPHVAQHIELLWNNAEAVADYFSELMIPSRPNRQGFPPEVAAEIMSLSVAFDRIGSVVFAEEVPKPVSSTMTYQWDSESLIEDKEGRGFAFTREGFAKAAEQGNREVCARFVEAGFDVDTRDARDWTPLMIAAFYGREPLALMFLDCGANLFAKDLDGYTPLHWAAFSGYREVVKLLLERGLPANVMSNAGISPLLQAAARGHLGVISLLLHHQANPNLNASDGSSPLLKAVANNHLEVATVLLNAGAYRNVTLKDGTTLDDIIAKAKDSRIRAIFA